MLVLEQMAQSNHLDMIAVERPAGETALVVPSVVHWKQNHYAAITEAKGGRYKVVDPTFLMSGQWLTADAINAECSGQFMVAATQVPQRWRVLGSMEIAQIFGKGFPQNFYPEPNPPCHPFRPLDECHPSRHEPAGR